MKKFNRRKKLNIISIFLVIDVLVLFAMFNISHASYTAQAVSNAEMEVALYAFRSDMLDKNDMQVDSLNLGDMEPGETKEFKINVYNYKKNGATSDTDIIYDLKVITTTNINLEYELYLNESYEENYASEIYKKTDDWGTTYNYILGPDRYFNYGVEMHDTYTLKITFPERYDDSRYQDLMESIKIQLVSRQAFSDENASMSSM